MKNLAALCFLINSLVSCGYRWQPDHPEGVPPTVRIPFVVGDEDGALTSAIIEAFTRSGIAKIKSTGDYELRISIVNEEEEKIGFRIDPQKIRGEVRQTLLASEGRKSMTVEAALYAKDQIAYGPYRISASAEYDYVDGDSLQDLTFVNPAGELVTVLPFSLGQLESVESAVQAATLPLYRRLAQKIVDVVGSNW